MDWETIIRHYRLNFTRKGEAELDWFRRQPSFETAIVVAARATDHRGKRFNHQIKIPRAALPEAERLLLEQANVLRACRSFHELWLLIKQTLQHVRGLGELYFYDTALRIGAFLNLAPERVYMHRGTRQGAKRFGFMRGNREWLNISEFPQSLRELSAQEIEDILCIYKDETLATRACR
jgi:hypothetical protein